MSAPNDALSDRSWVDESTEEFFRRMTERFGKLGKYKPGFHLYKGANHLLYLTRDCSYVADSFGWCFAVLLDSGRVVGVSLEPFSGVVIDIGKTYPGIGRDGRDFPLWPLVQRLTTEEFLFPRYLRKRVRAMLPRIQKLVDDVMIPFEMLQEVRDGKAVSVVS